MPKAVVSTEVEHFDLKTIPGGWVDLKRMDYGQKLDRAQMATDMKIEMAGKNGKAASASVDVMQKQVALFDFKNCLVDHNLYEDDAETQKLNLHTIAGLTKLDPRAGDEIGQLIDKLNNYEDEDGELGN